MTPDDRKVILASARNIIADASNLRPHQFRDIVLEAATIIRLCEAVEPWDRMPRLCSICRKPIEDRANHVVGTRLMHRTCVGTIPAKN